MSLLERFVFWLLAWLGVEVYAIGRKGVGTYLTRWMLRGKRFEGQGGKLMLHCFHRGDVEPYNHDHPWPFWSLILWGGYWEITPGPRRCSECGSEIIPGVAGNCCVSPYSEKTPSERRRWYGPLSFLRRPAKWQHRVKVPAGKHCWTLVWTGTKERSWGFHCPGRGFLPWRQHEANQAAGLPGCGEE